MIVSPEAFLYLWKDGKPYPKRMVGSDVSYFCPTKEMVENELYPNFKKWLASLNLGKWYHKWDCDNFADAFKVFCGGYYFNHIESNAEGIAVGVIHYMAEARAESGVAGAHAINIIFLNEGKNEDGSDKLGCKFFEPQNGKLFDLTSGEFASISFLYV